MSATVGVTPELLRAMALPQHDAEGDKGSRGCALIIGGSVPVPGAALLAATGALRAGAGILQVATCRSIAPHLGLVLPEALVIGLPETPLGGIDPAAAGAVLERAGRAQAVLIGPGMMDNDAAARLTAELLDGIEDTALVIDAAALTGLADAPEHLRRHAGRAIITPHAGEMAKFLGIERDRVTADPLAAARQAAERGGCVVAMKGACTFIVDPDGNAWSSTHGNIGLATSGSGDTLAGIVVGLLARGASPVQATLWAVYLHAEAGNRLARSQGPVGYLAHELLAEIPAIMRDLAAEADATGAS